MCVSSESYFSRRLPPSLFLIGCRMTAGFIFNTCITYLVRLYLDSFTQYWVNTLELSKSAHSCSPVRPHRIIKEIYFATSLKLYETEPQTASQNWSQPQLMHGKIPPLASAGRTEHPAAATCTLNQADGSSFMSITPVSTSYITDLIFFYI